jgi:hypothetical protein
METADAIGHTAVSFTIEQDNQIVFEDVAHVGYRMTGIHPVIAPETWYPAETGAFTLTIAIDVDNRVEETDELDNIIILTGTVLPASGQTYPLLDAQVALDDRWITNPEIPLTITHTGGVLDTVIVQTRQYDSLSDNVGEPQLIQTESITAVSTPTLSLPDTIKPGSVMLALWANDGQETRPVYLSVNYAPPNTPINKDELHCYPFNLHAGDNVQIKLNVPIGADANLFVWYPRNYGEPNLVGSRPGSDRSILSWAPLDGEYLLCVRGETEGQTTYTLTVATNEDVVIHPTHNENDEDAFMPDKRPFFIKSTPYPPTIIHTIYLPVLQRN